MKFFQSAVWTSAAVVLGGLAMLIGVLGTMAAFNSHQEVRVTLKDDITQDERANIQVLLTEFPAVQTVTYLSKEAALAEIRTMFKNSPSVWKNLSRDAVPATFRVRMSADADGSDRLVAALQGLPAVDEVRAPPKEGGGLFLDRKVQVVLWTFAFGCLSLLCGFAAVRRIRALRKVD